MDTTRTQLSAPPDLGSHAPGFCWALLSNHCRQAEGQSAYLVVGSHVTQVTLLVAVLARVLREALRKRGPSKRPEVRLRASSAVPSGPEPP